MLFTQNLLLVRFQINQAQFLISNKCNNLQYLLREEINRQQPLYATDVIFQNIDINPKILELNKAV